VNTTYTYDAWGRTITKTDGTHTATYLWAFGDKLKQYNSTFPGEEDVAYNYDGMGKRRVKVFNPSAPTDADHVWYRWDAGWNMIGEYAAGTNALTTWDIGALTRHYTTQPGGAKGQALAHADGDPDSAAYNYYATDHLGSPRTTYSQAKAVVAKQAFSPYGMPILSAGQRMDVGYTGHKWDDESDMFHAPYRYYNPYTARWLSRDPLGMVDGPNVYAYVMGNPVCLTDELGLDAGVLSGPGLIALVGMLLILLSVQVTGLAEQIGQALSDAAASIEELVENLAAWVQDRFAEFEYTTEVPRDYGECDGQQHPPGQRCVEMIAKYMYGGKRWRDFAKAVSVCMIEGLPDVIQKIKDLMEHTIV
jgi:RHS repeat-associated protein